MRTIILLMILLSSCTTTYKGIDANGVDVTIHKNKHGKIVKQIRKTENHTTTIYYAKK